MVNTFKTIITVFAFFLVGAIPITLSEFSGLGKTGGAIGILSIPLLVMLWYHFAIKFLGPEGFFGSKQLASLFGYGEEEPPQEPTQIRLDKDLKEKVNIIIPPELDGKNIVITSNDDITNQTIQTNNFQTQIQHKSAIILPDGFEYEKPQTNTNQTKDTEDNQIEPQQKGFDLTEKYLIGIALFITFILIVSIT